MKNTRFQWKTSGKALEENMVTGRNYRFTLLTSRLLRLEFDEDGVFENRATQSFFYRDFPPVEFSLETNSDFLRIETEDLILTYQKQTPFAAQTLSIQLKHTPATKWRFGEKADQLKGTARTLDRTNGSVELEDGVIARCGYTAIDDSRRMVLTEDGWFGIRKEGIEDTYFFGYGHDYLACIRDYYRVTGIPPLLPDYALGNWWSRFHPYTQAEYCQLMKRFEQEQIPFSVAVVDMNWHLEGWTGYTWNEKLFPDYRHFLKFLHDHHLKTALNLHPANGVGSHEVMYEAMANACGVDPESRKPVKLDCLNPWFMEHYFDIIHHPYEDDGVDFWWMDWQQGTDYWWIHDENHPASPLEQMDPLWILNHLHILDISRNGKRPMFFSRYSGIGSHRYPIGFSGDTTITWESLKFQPYFTANASNVGYSWWSHDIGGHMSGYRDDELTIRWMQLGVFSPINRLHSTVNRFSGKEPWNLFPYEAEIAKDWLRLRHRLFPYLYTMNYRNHTELIPLVMPMYYTHPEKDAAYRYQNQYWFGSEVFVNPITEKNDPCTRMGKTKVWFPEGKWIDAFNGYIYSGEQELTVYRNLEQMPIFAKAGAILPLEVYDADNRLGKKAELELLVFAGADNCFTMYEDAGDTDAYKTGAWVKTRLNLQWSQNPVVTICAAEGDLMLIPEKRTWTVKLRGIQKPKKVLVSSREATYTYDEDCATVTVVVADVAVEETVQITFCGEQELLYRNSGARNRIEEVLLHAQMAYNKKLAIWDRLHKENNDMFRACDEPEHAAVLGFMDEMLKLEADGAMDQEHG